MAYPTTLDTFVDKVDNTDVIYANDVNELQTAIESLEAKVGVDSSAVTSSHDYKLSEVTSTDKAVGKTATQTLTNKTLTSPVINVGSDATGDMYYRNAGVLTRLPVGTDNYILKVNGTVPNWEAETTTVNGSTTVAGIYESATATELANGTSTGGTGASLVVTPDIVTFSEFGNGNDGSLTYDGSTTILGMAPSSSIYTLTRDIYGTTITINNGVTIETAGYRIFAKTSLTNNGTIKRTPNNGGNASADTAGSGGAALSTGTIYGGLAGTSGGNGAAYGGMGSGNLGIAGGNGTAQTYSVGVVGVAGASGGAGGGDAGAPGSGGTAGALTLSTQTINNVMFATPMFDFSASVLIKSSSGSGGGGSGSARSSGSSGNSGGGGGSGSTGGIVWISARVLTNSGTISANGGNGGNGGNGSGGTANGGGGGGGGGAGGVVVLIYKSITLGTVSVTGGTGGTGGTGNGGAANGGNGTTGTTGNIIQLAC